ncbi:MAG: right-handed parallel beta-helix repeat-containing protein [Gammaproteobacteria bacterium]|nr:right-handed parallel beta-helix repeat-containing protein [Gammaproteobacteria bacterium]
MNRRITLLMWILVLTISGSVEGATWYMRQSTDVIKWHLVNPDDVICVSGTITSKIMVSASGIPGHPILVDFRCPGLPAGVADGSGQAGSPIQVIGRNNITLRGAECRNSSAACVFVGTSTDVLLENINAHHSKRGVEFYNVSNSTIQNSNAFSNASNGIFIQTVTGGTSAAIMLDGVRAWANSGGGIRTHGTSTSNPVRDVTIRNCETYGNSDGVYLVNTSGAVVNSSVSHDNTLASMYGEGYGFAAEACDHCTFYGNEAYGNQYKGLELWAEDSRPVYGLDVHQNYFHDNNVARAPWACEVDLNHQIGSVAAGARVKIYSNIISGPCGLLIHDGFTGIEIYSNSIMGAKAWAGLAAMFFSAGANNISWHNNTLQGDDAPAFWTSNAGVGSSLRHYGNSYYSRSSAAVRYQGSDHTSADFETGAIGISN